METHESYPDLIYVVVASLDKNGFRTKVIEFPCKETSKSFVADGARITKDKLGKIDSKVIESHSMFHLFTYCRQEDIEESKNRLTESIREKVNKVKTELEQILTHIP